ncbi:MAG: alkaline phosphatase family protein [Chloroflexota bacterium]
MSSVILFFRRKENWPIFVFPLLLMLWAQFGAPALGLASFTSAMLPTSPYLGALPSGAVGSPIAPRVVVVVVDGLRLDTSRQMPFLNSLRAQGADRALQVGEMSFSLPGWTVIGTGAWQEQSGVNSNLRKDPLTLDTIFLAAKRKGLTTALVGSKDWGQLYTTGVDVTRVIPDPAGAYYNLQLIRQNDEEMTALAVAALRSKPNLTLIHLPGPDNASHGFGGASKETAEIAQQIDAELSRIMGAVDLSETAFFLTSDHGHIDRGGHAGGEPDVLNVPLVSLGKGIKPGQYPKALQADIAPTVAVLLGTAIPSHNQGDALLDEVDAPDAIKAARVVDNAKQIAGRYEAMLQVIGSATGVDRQFLMHAEEALKAQNYSDAAAAAKASSDNARSRWAASRESRLNQERLTRLPLALLILTPFLLYIWWWRRARWSWRAPLAGAVTYFLVWNLIFFVVRRLYYSISLFNTEDNIRPFITARVIDAVIALLIAMLVVGLLCWRKPGISAARNAVNAMFVVEAALVTQILIFHVLWDVTPSWYLPDFLWGFKYYMDVYQTSAFWPLPFLPLAALLPIFTVFVAVAANRLVGRFARGPKPRVAPL